MIPAPPRHAGAPIVRGRRIGARNGARVLALVIGAALLGLPAQPVVAASLAMTLADATVAPTVFFPNGDGVRDRTSLAYRLLVASSVSAKVVDYRGATVRRLHGSLVRGAGTHRVAWDGRTGTGAMAPNGGYRIRLTITNAGGTYFVDRSVAKARSVVFPANPGAIVVALDAGHGGSDPGAVRDGFTEASANLDIMRRVRAMLEGAGVQVVMTRTADTIVNRSRVDWTGDGAVGYRDELAARVEIANRARADVFLCIHNNSSSGSTTRGSETFWWSRTFSAENQLLAGQVQGRVMSGLRTLATSRWRPIDRGVKRYDFYVLNGFDPVKRPRPSLMPGVLSEGLFVSNAGDRAVLRSSAGRQRIADAYYEALARYFTLRTAGARYKLLSPPAPTLAEGEAASATVRVTNTSPAAWSAGSVAATLAVLPGVGDYDGTNAAGTELARVAIPALAPGASVTVELPFTAPPWWTLAGSAGQALLKVDLVRDGGRFASRGVVPLQWSLTVSGGPTPPPEPTPLPSPSADPSPSAEPSPSDSAPPTATPSPSPIPSATASPAAGNGATGSPVPSPEPTPSPPAVTSAPPAP